MPFGYLKRVSIELNPGVGGDSGISSMQYPMHGPIDPAVAQTPAAISSAAALAQIAGIGPQPAGYNSVAPPPGQTIEDFNQMRYQPFPQPELAIKSQTTSMQMPAPMSVQAQFPPQQNFDYTQNKLNDMASQHSSSVATTALRRKREKEIEKYNRMITSATARSMSKPCRSCSGKQKFDASHKCVYDPMEGSLCANCVALHRPCIFDDIDEEELQFRLRGKNGEHHKPNSTRYRSVATATSANHQESMSMDPSPSPSPAPEAPDPKFDWGSIIINPEALPSYMFHCDKCGAKGHNFSDGHYQVACNNCAARQHAICHGISEEQRAGANFRFLCGSCERRQVHGGAVSLGPNVYHANLSSRTQKRGDRYGYLRRDA